MLFVARHQFQTGPFSLVGCLLSAPLISCSLAISGPANVPCLSLFKRKKKKGKKRSRHDPLGAGARGRTATDAPALSPNQPAPAGVMWQQQQQQQQAQQVEPHLLHDILDRARQALGGRLCNTSTGTASRVTLLTCKSIVRLGATTPF